MIGFCSCGRPFGKGAARGLCKNCYDRRYRAYGNHFASPRLPKAAQPPAWQKTEIGFYDCGQPAAWLFAVIVSERTPVELPLCDDCAALEKRLAPVHSWAGG
jgi:hypothetical protein